MKSVPPGSKFPTGLEGNGAGLVRELALASGVQRALERVYRLDRVADVHDFVHLAPLGGREALFVREAADGALEISLRLPVLGKGEIGIGEGRDLDGLCQIIEGVSHFVYLTDRASIDRSTTQLELEVQAEVDKYVVLAGSLGPLDAALSATLRARLYDDVSFAHDRASEQGERYRAANRLAHRFTARLERDFVSRGHFGELRQALRQFFRVGQEGKLRLGSA